jgi:hypothetical protein
MLFPGGNPRLHAICGSAGSTEDGPTVEQRAAASSLPEIRIGATDSADAGWSSVERVFPNGRGLFGASASHVMVFRLSPEILPISRNGDGR